MKLEVPFYQTEHSRDCGPISLRMVLAYFGEEHPINELSRLSRQLDTGMTYSAGIARAAKVLGFPAKYISLNISTNTHEEIDFYRTHIQDEGRTVLQDIVEEVRSMGIAEERDMPATELLGYVTRDSVPIVLLNWYVVRKIEGFTGNLVPVTGYDDDYVYVHNPGPREPRSHYPLQRNTFVQAWESKGTDKDTVIVYRKKVQQ